MAYTQKFALRYDAWAVALLLLFVVVFFFDLPSGYWRSDDTAILLHAINSKGLSAFYSPSDWQKLSPSNLTPWVTFSFKLDLWLSGLSPNVFYIHSMCSLAMVVVATYVFNRQWISPAWAFLSTGLFLVGAPTASVTELLMTRHYLEGLLFALISVIAFVQAVRRQNLLWAITGALAYALAVTAKEIYVPLVLLVLSVPPTEGFRSRLKLIAPYIGVAALYILWRRYMLGAMIGGYADADSIFSWRSVTGMVAVMQRFPEFLFGAHWVLPSAIFLIALSIALFRKPRAIPVFFALAVGVLSPLIPLIAFPGIFGPDRYLFLFWFAFSFIGMLSVQTTVTSVPSLSRLWQSVGIVAGLVMVMITLSYTNELQKSRASSYREFDVQGRFYFGADQHQAFIPSQTLLNSYWYITNLCDLKKVLGLECPTALIKGLPVTPPIERLFTFDSANNTMVDVSNRLQDERARIESIDTSRPLEAEISVENGLGRWNLGPYGDGQYYFASPSIGRYPVPRKGSLRTQLTHLAFYIQYESPQGWTTSSPLLSAGEKSPTTWVRPPSK